jgi:aminoglycoside phosphotransferase (APT) family kinase protein
MNEELVRFHAALRQVLANPAVAGIPDATLRNQLQMMDRVLGHLLVQQVTMPQVEAEALQAFVEAVDGVESLLSGRGLPVDAVLQLRALVGAASPASMDEILRPVRDLQQQLCAVASEEARARRRNLVAIETGCSTKLSDALEARLAPPSGGAGSTGAANTREIDEAKFNEFLTTVFPDEPGIRLAGYSFIAGGHSKYTAKVQLADVKAVPRSLVLRGDGSGKYGGASVRDEYRLLQVLHRNGVSVPRPLALDETGRTFGTPIMLVEEMPGQVIGHMFALPKPNPALCRDAAVQLARLHRIPVREFGDEAESADRTNREKATRWLDESYASFKALNRASPIYETAFHWLRDNLALNDGPRSLVHGDYGLNNLLIHADRVSAILDWEFAHIGNPIYDLGYFYFQADHLGSWGQFMGAYQEAGGVMPTDAQLDYSILFATTRLGVMVCQTEAAFAAGAVQGIGGAIACTGFHDVSVMRIARILERVL